MDTEKKKVKLVYLASPYNHADERVREARFRAVMAVVAEAFGDREKVCVYSPICHNHPISLHHPLPAAWDFWRDVDFPMIEHCDALVVLRMDGWRESVGIKAEIDHAAGLGMPVHFVDRWDDYRRMVGL